MYFEHDIQIILSLFDNTTTDLNVHDYPDRSLADERMAMLLYTLPNFNDESDNKIHVWQRLLFELLIILNYRYSLFFTCIILWKVMVGETGKIDTMSLS